MRSGPALVWLMLAAAAGCGSSLGSGPDSGAGGDGGSSPPSCAQAPRIDCSTGSAPSPTALCTLGEGIAYACGLLCPPHDANEWCATDTALVHGAKYTYIQFFNVDVWWISVYDQNGMLVAQLEASVNGQAAGQPWACVAGPADFDASEALSLLPVVGEGELPGMCGADGGTSGASCSRPLGDDCSPSPVQSTTANICTLDDGIGFACNLCGSQDAGQNCVFQSAMVRGAQYTYIQVLNVDVAFIYVYDQNNRLIAKLEWSANRFASGQQAWTCSEGPAVFDSTEAMALLPARSSELLCAR